MQSERLNNYVLKVLKDFEDNANIDAVYNIVDSTRVKYICIIQMFDDLYTKVPGKMDRYTYLSEEFHLAESVVRDVISKRDMYLNG